MERFQHRAFEPQRPIIPRIGPAAEPLERLVHEEVPWHGRERFPSEAARALAEDLRSRVGGEVRFDAGSRALYATDGSNYRQVPIGVVIPRSIEDVVETVATCRRHGAPVLSRGGGTSLAGQCCNVAVVIDFSKFLHHVVSLDPQARSAWVEPGLVLDDLREKAERYHLTFGPDPATHNRCTLGGMIGNDSCGVHSVMAGRTAENVEELEVLTYDGLRLRVGGASDRDVEAIVRAGGRRGEIYARMIALRDRYADEIRARYPKIERRVSGYNLSALLPENGFQVAKALVGSEGTLVTILRAKVRLVHSPPARSLLVLGYRDVYEAGDHITEIREYLPIGLEGMDEDLVEDIRKKKLHPERLNLLPEGKGWLLVEFGGDTKEESDGKARRCMEALREQKNAPSMKLYDDPEEEHIVWRVRESGLGATARVPGEPDTWEGWEDSAVPTDQVGPYLRDLRKLFDQYGYHCALYGHFGQGCIHTRIDFDLTSEAGIRKYRSFVEHAADVVLSHGGSLSGEHGDGQSRAELLPKMFGERLVRAFEELKAIWDPDWKLNPGKVVRPYRLDENLRLGAGYRELKPATHFRYTDDKGSFGRAAARCVGVGECRRENGGVMCPSYMVTREEMHSTRGRAHLLFEMMQGDPLRDGWRDEHVREALDLCLACKGCKSDCPMNVDMATYKAEFLSHYYAGRLRPRNAYTTGLIMDWARLARFAPRVANFLSHAPGLSRLAKLLGGIAPERNVPSFAPVSFREWFRWHERRNPGGDPVVLFADTFNDHFHPATAVAAVEVLEASGYAVEVHRRRLCCGRPLYDFGMLDRAKRQLVEIVDELTPYVDRGVPIVGLEPSCVAVLRDELTELFPDDPRAKKLSEHALLLSEFIEREGNRFLLPKVPVKALLQVHCHHHAVMKPDAEKEVLKRIGMEARDLDSGCCGMAGSFGFERGDHYRVAMAAGERVLLPAVREAPKATVVLANGFSCREQIAQATDRRALHLAEVIRMGLDGDPALGGPFPEAAIDESRVPLPMRARVARILPRAALLAAAGWLAYRMACRRLALP